jgi:DNA-directed RNA polymerase specialized sigma24 family protein
MNTINHPKNNPAKDFKLYDSDDRHLCKLSKNAREILELATNEGLNYGAIADITGAKMGTIKSRINRARTRILKMRAAAQTVDVSQAAFG